MTYLLDTDFCIHYLNRTSINAQIILEHISEYEIAICSVVKNELLFVAAKSTDPETMIFEIEVFTKRFASFPFDDVAAGVCARSRAELEKKGVTVSYNDLMIASIAIANHLDLLSNNPQLKHIDNLSVDPWKTM
jgi:tRNA(fMet)-specific endonuclease VapC